MGLFKKHNNPYDVTANSGKKAWWKCSKCNKSWEAKIVQRNNRCGCSCDSEQRCLHNFKQTKLRNVGSLFDNNPKLAKEWHPTKNGSLTPNDITSGVDYKVWWLCPTCGHEWKATVVHRKNGVGCPGGCRYSLVARNPALAKEWHPTRNGPLKPQDIKHQSKQRVWWLCSICKHEWVASVEWMAGVRIRDGFRIGCRKCKKLRGQLLNKRVRI
jgi:hypothetical protein